MYRVGDPSGFLGLGEVGGLGVVGATQSSDLAVGASLDGSDGDIAPAQQSHFLALLVGGSVFLVK